MKTMVIYSLKGIQRLQIQLVGELSRQRVSRGKGNACQQTRGCGIQGDHERIARVEGDGEREGFHFISLLLLASFTDAIFCSTLLSKIKAFFPT